MKFEPVRWMTWTLAILSALTGTGALMDILPARVAGALVVAVAVLTAVLGGITRAAVTPLARPRDASERSLGHL